MSLFNKKHPEERRKFTRVPFWLNVKFRIAETGLQSEEQFELVGCEDISEGGILLETAERYRMATFCLIEIHADTLGRTVHMEGQIVRSEKSSMGDFYYTGIAFIHMNDEKRRSLSEVIHHYA